MPRALGTPLRAAAFAVCLALPRPVDAADPALRFRSEVCELGSVVQGEQAACSFAFTNTGAAEVRILAVEPTCGCTTALSSAPLLRPGDSGEIRATFDSSAFAGEVVKEITVRSSDPARPAVVLAVKALVEPEVEFEPREAVFDAAGGGPEQRQIVMLTNRRSEAVEILSVTAAPSSYRCALPAWPDSARPFPIEPWDRVELDVTFTPPPAIVMPVPGECTLEIAGPRKRVFTLKLLAFPAAAR